MQRNRSLFAAEGNFSKLRQFPECIERFRILRSALDIQVKFLEFRKARKSRKIRFAVKVTEKEFEFLQFSATGKLRERLRTALQFFERREQGHIRYETPCLPAVGDSEPFEARKLI